MLTSHYMADVEALCRRVIVIHHGRLLYDGALSDLADRFSATKTLVVRFEDEPPTDLSGVGEELSRDGASVTMRVAKALVAQTTARLLADHAIADLSIGDVPIDDVIEQVFAGASTGTGVDSGTMSS